MVPISEGETRFKQASFLSIGFVPINSNSFYNPSKKSVNFTDDFCALGICFSVSLMKMTISMGRIKVRRKRRRQKNPVHLIPTDIPPPQRRTFLGGATKSAVRTHKERARRPTCAFSSPPNTLQPKEQLMHRRGRGPAIGAGAPFCPSIFQKSFIRQSRFCTRAEWGALHTLRGHPQLPKKNIKAPPFAFLSPLSRGGRQKKVWVNSVLYSSVRALSSFLGGKKMWGRSKLQPDNKN